MLMRRFVATFLLVFLSTAVRAQDRRKVSFTFDETALLKAGQNARRLQDTSEGWTASVSSPEGQQYDIRMSRKHLRGIQSELYVGDFLDHRGGNFIYIRGKEKSAGYVRYPGQKESWRISLDRASALAEAETMQEGDCAVPEDLRGTPILDGHAAADGQRPYIRLMILYTKKARELMGSEELIHHWIDLSYAYLIISLENSQINIDIELVYKGESSFISQGNITSDLYTLDTAVNGWGSYPEIGKWRKAVGADLVAMISDAESEKRYAGIAFLNGVSSVTHYRNLGAGTFAHEIGHNLGAHHNREEVGYPTGNGHNYGYNFVGDDGIQYSTVMSYGPGLRVPHFSNPDVFFRGVATGIRESEPKAANNARTIRDRAPVTSELMNLDPSLGPIVDFTSLRFDVEEGKESEILLKRTGTLAEGLRVQIRASSDTLRAQSDYVLASSAYFAPGSDSAVVKVKINPNPYPGCPREITLTILSGEKMLLGSRAEAVAKAWPPVGKYYPSLQNAGLLDLQNFVPSRLFPGINGETFIVTSSKPADAGSSEGQSWSNGLVRLNAAAQLDRDFSKQYPFQDIFGVVPRTDGALYIYGRLQNQEDYNFFRINSDGKLDEHYVQPVKVAPSSWFETSSGEIYLGGSSIAEVAGQRRHLIRLRKDGTIDADFVSTLSAPVRYLTANKKGEVLLASVPLFQVGVPLESTVQRLSPTGEVLESLSVPGRVSRISAYQDGWILNAVVVDEQGAQSRRAYFVSSETQGLRFEEILIPEIQGNWINLVGDSNGDLVLSGNFSSYAGVKIGNLIRLNSNLELRSCLTTDSGISNFDLRQGRLITFGSFKEAQGKITNRLAVWTNAKTELLKYPVSSSLMRDRFSSKLRLQFSGPVDMPYLLQGTENLSLWQDIEELSSFGGEKNYLFDMDQDLRFFRVLNLGEGLAELQ